MDLELFLQGIPRGYWRNISIPTVGESDICPAGFQNFYGRDYELCDCYSCQFKVRKSRMKLIK